MTLKESVSYLDTHWLEIPAESLKPIREVLLYIKDVLALVEDLSEWQIEWDSVDPQYPSVNNWLAREVASDIRNRFLRLETKAR